MGVPAGAEGPLAVAAVAQQFPQQGLEVQADTTAVELLIPLLPAFAGIFSAIRSNAIASLNDQISWPEEVLEAVGCQPR